MPFSRCQHLAYAPSVPNSGDVEERVVEEMTPSKAALETNSSNSLEYRETSFQDRVLSGYFNPECVIERKCVS